MTQLFTGGYKYANNILGGIQINTSLQGIPIPIVGGRNRISTNLLQYFNFISKLVTGGKKGASGGGSGKKGGGEYDYGAAVVLALCQGPIQRVGNIWSNNGYLPVNITQETYVVPPGGGAYTVTQINTFLQDLGCQEEIAYSVAANDFGSPYGALTLTGAQQVPMVASATVGVKWQPNTIFQVGALIFDGTNNQQCIIAGRSKSGSAPTWNVTVNGNTTDNQITWRNIGPPNTNGAGIYYQSGGTYHFSAADVGITVTINYSYAPPINTGGTAQDPIVTVGFSLFNGAQGQIPWTAPPLNLRRGYSTVAYLATPLLDLGPSATLPQLNVEVYGLFPFGRGVWDCDLSVFSYAMLTDPIWGCGVETTNIGSMTQFSNYIVANGLFGSPICKDQRTARDYLNDFLEATNTELVESGGVLNFIPRGDTTVVGNGATFTPQTAPIYNLTDDDLIREGSAPPIVVTRPTIQDASNSVRVEYVDVENNYNASIIEAQDIGLISLYKYRPEAPRSYHFFTSQAPAALAAQTILSRKVYIRNTYKFKLQTTFFLLDPMDIVMIPNSLIYGTADTTMIPVRITSISENQDSTLSIEAEDFPWGCSGPTLYPRQGGSPTVPSTYAAPGSVNTPIIFEALSRLNNQIGHYVWFGLSGANQNWGGCNIWVSLDGVTYQRAGTAISQCTMGVSTATFPSGSDPDTTDTLAVDLTESFGELMSATMGLADANATLFYIGGELCSYEAATLTSAFKYNIGTYIRRGVFGSVIGSHSSGSPFLLLNDSVEGWNYDVGIIGQTVHFKFTSFNQSGLVEEDLADVTDYPYTITGDSIGLLTPAHASYAPTSNPLTGHDAGSSATINIASFDMRVPGMADIAENSGSIAGLNYNTLYYVYFDDPGFLGQAANGAAGVVYEATTTKSTALEGAGRFFVGSITTPRAGAPDTTGNGDGGASAQLGLVDRLSMSQNEIMGQLGDGAVANPYSAIDGNQTTYAAITASGAGGGTAYLVLSGPPGINRAYSSGVLFVDAAIPVNSWLSIPHFGTIGIGYSLDGGQTENIIPAFSPGTGVTVARQTVQIVLPAGQNLSLVQVQAGSSNLGQLGHSLTGAGEVDVYEVWIEGTN